MSLTLFSWFLGLSAVISLGLSIVAFRRRAITGALPFAFTLLGEFLWCAGYWCELRAPLLGDKLFWDNVQFLGTDICVVSALLFAWLYTGHEAWLRRYGAMLAIVPGLTFLLVWSNPLHDLVRSAPQLVRVDGQDFLVYAYGPWFWVFVGYDYLLTLATLGVLIVFTVQLRSYRQQVFAFVLGFSAPAIGALMTVFGLIPIAGLERLDISALTFTFTSPLMAWALFRKRLLDIVPVARTLLVEQMRDAVLVIDVQGRVVDTNAYAIQLLRKPGALIIGTPISALLPALAQLIAAVDDSGRGELCLGQQPPIAIEAAITALRSRRGGHMGWLVVLRDITAQKAMLERLRLQEELFRLTFDQSPSGAGIVGLDFRFLQVNDALCQISGYARDELLAIAFHSISHPDDRGLDIGQAQALAAGQIDQYSLAKRYIRKDGQIVSVQLTVRMVCAADGSPLHYLALVEDITARLRIETTVEQQSRYHRTLASCSQVLLRGGDRLREIDSVLEEVLGLLREATNVGRIDLCQNMLDADGEIHAQMIAEERSAQVAPFPLTGCLPWSLLPQLRDALMQGRVLSGPVASLFADNPDLARTLADGGVRSLLLMPLYGADGWWGILRACSDRPEQIWGEATIEFLRAAADMIAVSVRQWDATRTLREREHFIQRVAHATPDMIYVYDLRERRMIYTNTAATPPGQAPEQIAGLDEADPALYPDEREQRKAYAEQIAAAADQEVCSLEYHVQAADGHSRWMLRRDTIFARDAIGVPSQILGVVQDITERRRRAEALLQAKDAAEAANRAKSTFLAMMSHELRTPLTAIIGYSQLIGQLMADGDNRSIASDLGHIHTAGNHLLALINNVLDLSQIEAGQLQIQAERALVTDIVRDAASSVGPLLEQNCNTLHISCPDGIAPMYTDATKVRQVIMNLLNNATKFTRAGEITLTVEQARLTDTTWIIFRVADTGIGIDTSQMRKLFKPFSQVDESLSRRYGGTGLGLSLSQRLCHLLGGTISVESRLGVGSVFTVRLPSHVASGEDDLAASPSAAQAPSGTDAPDHPPSNLRTANDKIMLVIDDNPTAGAMIGHLLGPDSACVVHATDGPQGIDLAHDVLPDLIVLNLLAPALDSFQLLSDLKADPDIADIPVFLVGIDHERGRAFGIAKHSGGPPDRERLAHALPRGEHSLADLAGQLQRLVVDCRTPLIRRQNL